MAAATNVYVSDGKRAARLCTSQKRFITTLSAWREKIPYPAKKAIEGSIRVDELGKTFS